MGQKTKFGKDFYTHKP